MLSQTKTRVSGAANWSAASTWLQVRSGTISATNGSVNVTGSGTLFSSELQQGDILVNDGSGAIIGTVSSIASNTSLTLISGAPGGINVLAYGRQRVPEAADEVQIGNSGINQNVTVTFDVANATVNSLTFPSLGSNNTLTHAGANTLNITNALTLNHPLATNTTLAHIINGGTVNAGTVVLGGSGNKARSLCKIAVTTGSLNITRDLNYNLPVSADQGVIDLSGGAATMRVGGNIILTGAGVGTLTPGTASTVEFNGSGVQSILGSNSTIAYRHIHINKSGGTATLNNNLTAAGNVTLTQGTLSPGGFTASVGGNWTNNGGTYSGGSGTLNFNGSGTQTIGGTVTLQTFTNLTLNKTAGSLLNVGGSTTAITVTNYTQTTGDYTAPASFTAIGNVSLSAGTLTAGSNISVGGNWSRSSTANFTPVTGTITFNGSAAQVITGTATSRTFHNFVVNKASGSALSFSGSATSITVNDLTLTAGDFTASPTVTINGNFLLSSGTYTSSTTTILAGNYTNNGGTNNNASGTWVLNGTGTQTLSKFTNNLSFYNLTINKSLGSVAYGSNITALSVSDFTLTAGTFQAPATLTISGNALFSSGTFTDGITINLGGNWTNNGATFNNSGNTVVLKGSANQTLGGSVSPLSYNNLTVNKSAGVAVLNTSIAINGTLTFTTGRIQTGNNTVTIPAGGSVSGAAQSTGWVEGRLQKNYATGSSIVQTYEVGGVSAYTPMSINIVSVTTAGNVVANVTSTDHPNSNNAGMDNLKSVNRYYTLTNSGTVFTDAAITFNWMTGDVDAGASTSAFIVKRYASNSWSEITSTSPAATSIQATGVTAFGDFAIGEAGAALGGIVKNRVLGTANWSSAATWMQSRGGTITTGTNSATVTGTGTFFTQELQIGDILVSNTGAVIGTISSIASNTSLTLTGNAANGGTSIAYSRQRVPGIYDDVQIGNSAITQAVTVNYDVANATVNSLTFVTHGQSNMLTHNGTNALTITGNLILNHPSGNATSSYTINGGTVNVGNNVVFTGATKTQNAVSKVVLTTGALNITGDLNYNLPSGSSADQGLIDLSGGAATMKISGNTTLTGAGTGTITPGTSSTVEFNGTSAQTINFGSVLRYNSITITNNAGVTPGAAITINPTLVGGNIRVLSGTLNNGGYAITGVSAKTFEVGNGATFNITGTSGMVTGFNAKTFGASSTVNYSGGAQTVSLESYGHLTLSGSGTKIMPASAMTIYGNFTTSGTVSATASNTLTINGNVTLGSGTTFGGGSFTHNVAGNWTNNGATFTASISTINLNGKVDQTLGGTVSTLTYNHLTVNKASGAAVLATNATVNGVLTFTKGRIQAGNFIVIIPSTGSVSGAGASTGWVHGKLQKNVATGSAITRTFEIGGTTNYTPATVSFASVTTAGDLVANITNTDQPNLSTSGLNSTLSVNRYWTITNPGVVFTTASITMNWVSADVDGGANTENFKVKSYNGSSWTAVTEALPTSTSIEATGVTVFGDFAIGEMIGLITWSGTTSTDWSISTNWSPSVIPTSSYNVNIPANLSTYPVISNGTLAVRDLAIEAAASVTIGGGTLQISGSITNNGSITATNGTVELNGTAAQSIPASAFEMNTLKNLIVNNSAGVTLGGTLNLTDVITISNGSLTTGGFLTLKSTATATARIAPITAVAATPVIGTVTVERYVASRRKYRLITSPVTTSNSSSLTTGQENLSIWGAWQNSGNTTASNIGTFITGGTATDGFDTQTSNASLYTYDVVNRKWVGYTSANGKNTKYTPLKAGEAYYLFVYGDRKNTLTTSTPNTTVLTATGTLLTGTQTYTPSSSLPLNNTVGGFTLIGNPYASPINWAALLKTGIDNTYWGWDPNLSGTGGYVTVTTSGTTTLIAPYNGSVGLNQYIQSGQGFFVRTNDAAPQLTIRESDKVGNFNGIAFIPVDNVAYENTQTGLDNDVNAIPLLAINLFYNNGTSDILADGALAAYDTSFVNEIGPEDAVKMIPFTESIGIANGSALLSIDGRHIPQQSDTMQLKVGKLTRNQYTLQIFGQQLQSANMQAYLKDAYLNTTQELNLADTNRIVFNVNTSDAASFDANRFAIFFEQQTVLPVAFHTINAAKKDDNIQVDWAVSNGSGIVKFVVEKSSDTANFYTLGEVPAISVTGYNKYAWTDVQPKTGNNYYRIRFVQANGKFAYSKSVLVKINAGETSVKVYPNPIINRQVTIKLKEVNAGMLTILLYNRQGQVVQQKLVKHPGGNTSYPVLINKNAASGLYYLKVMNEQFIYQQPVMIE